jgi:hypothetical protein
MDGVYGRGEDELGKPSLPRYESKRETFYRRDSLGSFGRSFNSTQLRATRLQPSERVQ